MTGTNAIHCAEKPISNARAAQQPSAETAPPPPYSSVVLQPAQLGQGFTSVSFNRPTAVPVNTLAQVEKVPRDYLYLAIFSTVFCFFPVGLVAIVNARDVHKKFSQGDTLSAHQASSRAKYLSIAAMLFGILIFLIAGMEAYKEHKDDGTMNDHPFNCIIND